MPKFNQKQNKSVIRSNWVPGIILLKVTPSPPSAILAWLFIRAAQRSLIANMHRSENRWLGDKTMIDEHALEIFLGHVDGILELELLTNADDYAEAES